MCCPHFLFPCFPSLSSWGKENSHSSDWLKTTQVPGRGTLGATDPFNIFLCVFPLFFLLLSPPPPPKKKKEHLTPGSKISSAGMDGACKPSGVLCLLTLAENFTWPLEAPHGLHGEGRKLGISDVCPRFLEGSVQKGQKSQVQLHCRSFGKGGSSKGLKALRSVLLSDPLKWSLYRFS